MLLSGEIAKKVGVSKRTIQQWVERGLLVPCIDSNQRGVKRQYNKRNLFEAKIIARILEYMHDTNIALQCMNEIKQEYNLLTYKFICFFFRNSKIVHTASNWNHTSTYCPIDFDFMFVLHLPK